MVEMRGREMKSENNNPTRKSIEIGRRRRKKEKEEE
jgi:hypothetical protein